jgi:hypothetical protein
MERISYTRIGTMSICVSGAALLFLEYLKVGFGMKCPKSKLLDKSKSRHGAHKWSNRQPRVMASA